MTSHITDLIKQYLPTLKKILIKFPFWYCVLITVISLQVKENFPFSHYPMYSSFRPYTFYLFVSDENDQTLGMKKEFRHSASHLKKLWSKLYRNKAGKKAGFTVHDKERRKIMFSSGQKTLNKLIQYRKKYFNDVPYKKLNLWFVRVVRDGNKIIEENYKISEIHIE